MRSQSARFLVCSLIAGIVRCAGSLTAADAPGWSRFRGPNGSGVSSAMNVPIEFGAAKNLLWRLALPRGHSSPIIKGDRIYLTGLGDDATLTFARHRSTARIALECTLLAAN